MKTVEEYLDRNIKVLQEKARKDRAFGISYVQRLCRVGYNQACHTVERAVEQGVLVNDEERDWQYRFSS